MEGRSRLAVAAGRGFLDRERAGVELGRGDVIALDDCYNRSWPKPMGILITLAPE